MHRRRCHRRRCQSFPAAAEIDRGRLTKGIIMNSVKMLAVAGCLAVACGCMTSPVAFKSESSPVPPQGYTVLGSDVTGTSEQIWVFGFGGSLAAQQHKAYKTAIGNANGADALVGMSIEHSSLYAFPFFTMSTIRVTGTPVKYNPPK